MWQTSKNKEERRTWAHSPSSERVLSLKRAPFA